MKKFLILVMALCLMITVSACSGGQEEVASETDINSGSTSSDSDISHLTGLDGIPEYSGKGTFEYSWETNTSGFWVSGSDLEDMKKYGDKLAKAGWILNEAVTDYDPEGILYYNSSDGGRVIQLKLMEDTFIRLTVGDPPSVMGLV